MSENETYNGWHGFRNRASAYATWRVNLEICDDYIESTSQDIPRYQEPFADVHALADTLEEVTKELVRGEDYNEQNIATQYAMAFLDDVNWYEIAEHAVDNYPHMFASDDDEDNEE